MKTVRFGIIGAGMMGREIASAMARWAHLPEMKVRPEVAAVAARSPEKLGWFKDGFPSLKIAATDYRELVREPSIDAFYVAVPHNLHEEIYCAVISSGKHLLGEKPFGMDEKANKAILAALKQHPGSFARCASEFVFFPAVQRICDMLEAGAMGRIIEVNAGFLHSSDLDASKPINWKRMVELNGEYGCMGDLGMHICAVPFRAGFVPRDVRAILSKIVGERPDGKGGRAPCLTWDNATLLCRTVDPSSGATFPMTLKTHRIAPGEKNTWYLEILGARASARFSTKNPKLLQVLEYKGGEQAWQNLDMGQETAFKTITGGVLEFGLSDAILQMLASFLRELTEGKPAKKFAGCVTPEETALSHRLFTAALKSHAEGKVVKLPALKGGASERNCAVAIRQPASARKLRRGRLRHRDSP